jgi:hypothetical protein
MDRESSRMHGRRLEELARQFPENGIKLLMENSSNVRDLLILAGTDVVEFIDFDRLARFKLLSLSAITARLIRISFFALRFDRRKAAVLEGRS